MSGKLTLLAFVLALAGYASGAEAFSQKVMNTCGSGEDLDAAIKACTQLIDGKESKSTKVAAYFNRAWAYRSKGQPDLAVADDTRAIELDPKAYRAFADRGAAYHDKGEYDLAIADATRSIELNPKESVTYNNRGQAYRAKGDYDRAFADLNRAIELNPKNSNALYNRGTAYLDKTDYEQAITDLTRALVLDPKSAEARKYRAIAYLKTSKFDLARADLTKALELKPDYPEAKATLSELEQVEATGKGLPAPQQAAAEPAALLSQPAVAGPSEATPAAAPLGKRVALVIGNSQYENIGRLDNPINDAKLISAALKDAGFELVGDGPQLDLDKAELERAVQDFGNRLQGADVALFYYAGHGVQVRGANYLVPVNANPTKETDVDFQMLDANLVLRQMESAGTRLNLVMLDACRNNPFAGRGLRATGGGLAQMQAPEGTLISFATEPGTVAQDGSDGNSPYTKALAEIIRTPGLGIFDTFNQVGLKVKQSTGGAQRPWLSSSPIEGAFYFRPGP